MQTPSPTGALGSPPFLALGWRRMGDETDSLRMRYLSKLRKMREKRNKKIAGVRKSSISKPKVAPATPMDTTPSEAPTSELTAHQQNVLDRFRITIETFGSEAEAEWAALWPQSLGPGLEEAERAMRSFHLPNGELELYIQEYDPDASDEMVTVQVFVNLCYLLCKGETEEFRKTWAEMEVAYAEYLQKVASASGESATDVPMTTPTAAPGTNTATLPTGPVWSGRAARKDAVAKTCLYAVKGAIVGVGSTYISAQGVAGLVAAGLLAPGLAASVATGASAVLVGNFVLKPLLERVIAGAAALPVPTTGVLLDGALAVPLRTGELDLVNYEDTLQTLVGKQKGPIVKFLCGFGPNALQGEVAFENQKLLFPELELEKPIEQMSELGYYLSRGQVSMRQGGNTVLTPVGELEDGVVTNLFRKHHITAQIPESTESSLLRGGQTAVLKKMDLAGKRNRWWHFKKAREEYIKEVTQLDSAEGADNSILPNRPRRVYGMLAASHLASGFVQQRWAKQKMTVDYVKSMLGETEAERLQAEIVEVEEKLKWAAEEQEKAMLQHAAAVANGDPAGTIQYRLLQLDRSKLLRDRVEGRLRRLRDKGTSKISRAVTVIENKLCAVSSAHIAAYITRGEQSNPRKGILRAHLLPGMARPAGTAPLGPEFHVAAEYTDDWRGANSLARFQAYTTLTAEDERRTIRYYFEDVLGKETQTQLEKLAPRVDPDPGSANKERDFSLIGGWLGMNPKGNARGDLKTFYQMVDHFNAEKTRLIDKRLLALGPGEDPKDVYADRDDLTTISDERPCNGTAAAPNGAVSVVDAAFARLTV